MKVSVSVLTYNSAETLSECLNSILYEFDRIKKLKYEINVLNNGSTDHTKSVILSKKGNINYYENEVNQTFTKCFNYLLSKSSGEVFCITSDDIIFKDGIINYVINYYKEELNKHDIIAPKTILPDNNLDRVNKKNLREKDLLFGFTILGTILNYSKSGLDQTKSTKAEVLQDSCLFFSDKAYIDFKFDERFKFYFTEDALSKQLLNKNYILRYDTNISVKHYLKVGTKKSKNTRMNLIYFKDCIKYSNVYSNKLFHYFIFIPLIYLTIFLKYIKWKLDPEHYV